MTVGTDNKKEKREFFEYWTYHLTEPSANNAHAYWYPAPI